MSNDMNNVWRSIADDGAEVPVSVGTPAGPSPASSIPVQGETSYVRVNPSMNGSMSLAAVSGILLVLLSGATFYLGTDFLRASISGTNETIPVLITEMGSFVPSQVDMKPGDTLSVLNKNENPQLLKGQDERTILFGEQIILPEETFDYNLPLNAPAGTYVLTSEILPGQTLTVTVIAQGSSSSSEAAMESAPENSDDFMQNVLIPSLNDLGPAAPAAPLSSESSSSSSVSSVAPSQNPLQSQSFLLTQDQSAFAPLQNFIETNPFTIGNVKNRPLPGQSSSKKALHGGAPLITQHTPRTSTASGPSTWLLVMLMFLSISFVGIRVKRMIG